MGAFRYGPSSFGKSGADIQLQHSMLENGATIEIPSEGVLKGLKSSDIPSFNPFDPKLQVEYLEKLQEITEKAITEHSEIIIIDSYKVDHHNKSKRWWQFWKS